MQGARTTRRLFGKELTSVGMSAGRKEGSLAMPLLVPTLPMVPARRQKAAQYVLEEREQSALFSSFCSTANVDASKIPYLWPWIRETALAMAILNS